MERHGIDGLTLNRNAPVTVPGLTGVVAPILATPRKGGQVVIGLHSPLTPGASSDDGLNQLKEFSLAVPVVLVDELVVRRNLPSATASLLEKLS